MPALKATNFEGVVKWLGILSDRSETLETTAVKKLYMGFDGVRGDAHSGLTRPSCSRVIQQYPKGTSIKNTRQLSIVSYENLQEIAQKMGIEMLAPSLVGANMVIYGIPDFSHIPPSSRLQVETGATFCVDMENRPCHLPAKPIDEHYWGAGSLFKQAADGNRGVMASVEAEGVVKLGNKIRLHIPDQPAWAGIDTKCNG